MKRVFSYTAGSIPLLLIASLSAGCAPSGSSHQPPSAMSKTSVVPAVPAASNTDSAEDHAHKSGAHGGIVVSLGRDSYHVEAIVEQGGTLFLYMLGSDESRVVEVAEQDLIAYVKPEGAADSISVPVVAQHQPGDSAGKASCFKAKLPAEAESKNIDVTVPSIVIAGERFRLGFTTISAGDHSADGMPSKVANDQERELYLTPGGLYTADDIAANGNVTVSQKFKGVMAKHDLKPKAGDMLCPITFTKANPKFTWIVGGKNYEFCCPPCVDEFVGMAKRSSPEIKEPAEYIKR